MSWASIDVSPRIIMKTCHPPRTGTATPMAILRIYASVHPTGGVNAAHCAICQPGVSLAVWETPPYRSPMWVCVRVRSSALVKKAHLVSGTAKEIKRFHKMAPTERDDDPATKAKPCPVTGVS